MKHFRVICISHRNVDHVCFSLGFEKAAAMFLLMFPIFAETGSFKAFLFLRIQQPPFLLNFQVECLHIKINLQWSIYSYSVIPHLGLPNENVFHNHPYFKITPQKTVFPMAAGRDPQTTWIASAGLVLVPLWQHFLLNFPFTHSFLHCHCAILICIFEIIFTREVTSTRTPQHAHMIGRILRRIPPMSCLSTFILLVSPIYIWLIF